MIPLTYIITLLRCKWKTTGEDRLLCQIMYSFSAPTGSVPKSPQGHPPMLVKKSGGTCKPIAPVQSHLSFWGAITSWYETGGHQITVLGGCCHFPTDVHNPFWHGLLILVSPFHIRKASSVGVISFYGSQELSNYIFHEAFSTVISYSCVVGFPRKPVFLGWLCYIHILTEANLKRIHKKPRKILDISVKWILRTSTIKINERQDNGGTVKLR